MISISCENEIYALCENNLDYNTCDWGRMSSNICSICHFTITTLGIYLALHVLQLMLPLPRHGKDYIRLSTVDLYVQGICDAFLPSSFYSSYSSLEPNTNWPPRIVSQPT